MPQIPTRNIWLSFFALFCFRMGSFHATEMELRRKNRWESWVGKQKPSADTLGRVASLFNIASLRHLLVTINRTAWRSKAIHMRSEESYRVVAVDGHELFASRSRCCDECLIRKITVKGKEVLEYYHRIVVAQWVGVTPPGILDMERIHPKEGEVVAARRLVKRVIQSYGRLIDMPNDCGV